MAAPEAKYGNLTYMFNAKGNCVVCATDVCFGNAVKEYYGYCSDCWINLTAEERAILKREEPPLRPVVKQEVLPVIERVRVVYPVRYWLSGLLLGLWRGGVSVAVGYLIWKGMR